MHSLRKLLAAGVALVGLCCSSTSQAAFTLTETFSVTGSTAGWASAFGAFTLGQSNANGGELTFSGTAGTPYGDFLNATSTASGGAFVGNYGAAGLTLFTFSVFLDPGSTATYLGIDLYNSNTGDEWSYELPVPPTGGLYTFNVPLEADPNWVQVNGSNSLNFLLNNNTDIGIAFFAAGGGTMSGYVDNITIAVPEPGTVLGGTLALGCAGFYLRRRRSETARRA